ncbi:histidine phosphatase family protein [Neobacillus niacini]|uniref:histidine phosphatase family protein n=1 Tax=Neobacillus niacini TaxID=86668 RepID=UPI0021CB159A|nr:histidine phosphatase family protein [Neobacillus niacini]MCM3766785.1 histidine phosphatase family protein [Neobacillus niacini]
MEKRVYVVRHCEAEGQPSEAPLTEIGFRQAATLAKFLIEEKVDRIISSPFLRAVQSIEPTATLKGMQIETNDRLAERILSTHVLDDWLVKLEATFADLEMKFAGGESSREAMNRIVSVVEEILEGEAVNTLIVTHGNLMALLLHHYQPSFGFEEWKNLGNPDVFLLKFREDHVTIEHVWR